MQHLKFKRTEPETWEFKHEGGFYKIAKGRTTKVWHLYVRISRREGWTRIPVKALDSMGRTMPVAKRNASNYFLAGVRPEDERWEEG